MDDFFSFKNILATISAPLTFILGLIGWHYKNVYSKVETLDASTNKLQIMVSEHSIHVQHLHESFKSLDEKIDYILEKLNLIK